VSVAPTQHYQGALPRRDVALRRERALLRDGVLCCERGSVQVEYVVVLVLVAVVVAGAIAGLGLPLLRHFHAQVAWLMLPVP
jgi:Flp pilus assembly pilin Flp